MSGQAISPSILQLEPARFELGHVRLDHFLPIPPLEPARLESGHVRSDKAISLSIPPLQPARFESGHVRSGQAISPSIPQSGHDTICIFGCFF